MLVLIPILRRILAGPIELTEVVGPSKWQHHRRGLREIYTLAGAQMRWRRY